MNLRADNRVLPPLKDALEKLAQAVRTFRLTQGETARRQQILSSLMALLAPIFDTTSSLTFIVSPFALTWRGTTVYEQSDRAESLAFRLFRDGVASLVIEDTVGIAELGSFVDLLAIPPGLAEQVGEDTVTRLWTSPLESIWVTERAWYAFRLMDPFNHDPIQLRAAAADAMVFFHAGVSQGNTDISMIYTPNELRTLWDTMSAGNDNPMPLTIPTSPVDDASTDASRLSTRHALEELSALLQAALLTEDAKVHPDELATLYLVLLRALLSFGEEASLRHQVEVLSKIKTSPKISKARGEILDSVLGQVASSKSMKQLLLGTSSQRRMGDMSWVPEFFAEHTREADGAFVPLFSLNLTSSSLSLLTRVLWQLEGPQSDFWIDLVEKLPEDVASEVMHLIIERGDPEFNAAVYVAATSHPGAAVRTMAIERLPQTGDLRVKTAVVEMLRDEVSSVRVAAINRLGALGDSALGIFLVDRFRHADFSLMPHTEQKALLINLARLGGTRYLKLIIKQLDAVEKLLRDPVADEIKMAEARRTGGYALTALAVLKDPKVHELITRRLQDAPASLRDAYQHALESYQEAERDPIEAEHSAIEAHHRRSAIFDPLPPLVPSIDPAFAEDTESSDRDIEDLLSAYINEDASLQSMVAWPSSPTDGSHSSHDEISWPGQEMPGSPVDMDVLLKAYLDPTEEHRVLSDSFAPTGDDPYEVSGAPSLNQELSEASDPSSPDEDLSEEEPVEEEAPDEDPDDLDSDLDRDLENALAVQDSSLGPLPELPQDPSQDDPFLDADSPSQAPPSHPAPEQSSGWDPPSEFMRVIDGVGLISGSSLPGFSIDESEVPSDISELLDPAEEGEKKVPPAPAIVPPSMDTPMTAPLPEDEAPSSDPEKNNTAAETPRAKESARRQALQEKRRRELGKRPAWKLRQSNDESGGINVLAEASWMEAFDDPELDGEVSELIDDLMDYEGIEPDEDE